jgi:hypothetical protein
MRIKLPTKKKKKTENRKTIFYKLCVTFLTLQVLRGGLGLIHRTHVIPCNTTFNLASFCHIRFTRVVSLSAHVSSFVRTVMLLLNFCLGCLCVILIATMELKVMLYPTRLFNVVNMFV